MPASNVTTRMVSTKSSLTLAPKITMGIRVKRTCEQIRHGIDLADGHARARLQPESNILWRPDIHRRQRRFEGRLQNATRIVRSSNAHQHRGLPV